MRRFVLPECIAFNDCFWWRLNSASWFPACRQDVNCHQSKGGDHRERFLLHLSSPMPARTRQYFVLFDILQDVLQTIQLEMPFKPSWGYVTEDVSPTVIRLDEAETLVAMPRDHPSDHLTTPLSWWRERHVGRQLQLCLVVTGIGDKRSRDESPNTKKGNTPLPITLFLQHGPGRFVLYKAR